MKTKILSIVATTAMLLAAAPSMADKLEAVHMINYPSSERAKADIGALVKDPAMAGHKLTLYAREFGDLPVSHLVVEDFDSYGEYMDSTAKRFASPGWARYALESQIDTHYRGSDLVTVVDDYGAKRRSAGYLAATIVNVTNAAAYRAALAELNRAVGHPGVMRLVAFRTGNMAATHAVLIGGSDFKAVNEYLDKLYASDAYAKFSTKVGPIRKVVSVWMLQRVGTWGD
jgi:hypothetical protein